MTRFIVDERAEKIGYHITILQNTIMEWNKLGTRPNCVLEKYMLDLSYAVLGIANNKYRYLCIEVGNHRFHSR